MNTQKIHLIFTWKEYLLFFLLNAIVVSCNFLLFFEFYIKDGKELYLSSIVTFGNILFLSLFCVFFYGLWHKIYVERPVKKILDATTAVAAGNFDTRIDIPKKAIMRLNEFDQIILNFNLMTKELAGTETLQTDFIANVTHELKTPLASIQNYSTLLQSPLITPANQREYTDAIIRNSKQLSDLITNILKLNKLENQQIFPETSLFNLSEQVTECILSYESLWESKHIDIDTDIEEDIMIHADSSLLTLVWNNLLSNAMKFTPVGGKVSLSLHQVGNTAQFVITDTGCGMGKETISHIFEKFYQGDRSHAQQGNGLGLALAKKVTDIFHGTIKAESSESKGSIFIVCLPL